MKNARKVLIIPARRRSTRLPEKLLLRETGKTVLQYTYEAACRAKQPDAVIIAVDDELLAEEARRFGASVVMTSPDHTSGTDRVAEAATSLPNAEIIVNLQADEPEINPADIDKLFDTLEANPRAGVATLATPIRDRESLEDPACVKVVFDNRGEAMYFSRSAIPHPRDWDENLLTAQPAQFHQHIGIYAYRRWPLLRLAQLPPSPAEQIEKLEQLRILQQGDAILVATVKQATRGIDTHADYAAFVERCRAA
ncbi:3-deoxy-manno-octulosonate cytidylyltransferase [Adhaeretor mobilis]|uniref:3-deoxy-manno-octulosonate cytidylyltransferase n=1 Tax=Adhaeretor mobilis TaxID=1930276 RepID=A0A517MSQ2_9BACT|nr:3-deoxy-manno-octulosonate cytidylyltransferase [Adhaeretor mobilis]QDS97916.1 3-deoxy-manno-octulosonate cytidylyltransferase [Adhaeretor mobilis]